MKMGVCKVSVVLDVCFCKSIFESIMGRKKFLVFNDHIGFYPSGSEGKESASDAGILGLIPGWGRSPGGGSITHSSILAWRIPSTEEPGRLQFTGSQKVRHD